LDVQLPDIDGLQVARRIRECGDRIWQPYLIALTADTQPSTRAAYVRAGMDTYLAKPLQMSELHAVLATYHNATLAASPGMDAAVSETPLPASSVSAERPLDPQALERLRSLFGPHRARLDALIKHYCADTAELPAKLYQAAAANDAEMLRRSLHQLKSSSAIVAALRLAMLAEGLEQAVSTSEPEEWRAWIARIEEEYLRVRTALEAELNQD
jgi:CheY-like chemotaxis protein